MQMTLLFITVWFTHFLIASAFNFNTLPAHTPSGYTETTQTTPITTTTTNQQPKTLIKATPSSPLTTITQENTTNLTTEVHIQPNTAPSQETTSLHQYNSTPPRNDMMDEGVSISSASDSAIRHTNTITTVSTNSPRLTSQEDENNETWTTSKVDYNNNRYTAEPNVTSTMEMTSLHQYNSNPFQNDTDDEDVSISNAGDVPMNYTIITPTVFTNFTRLKSQYNENETRTMSNVSYNDDGDTTELNTTPNVTSMNQYNSSPSQNHLLDEGVSISNASDVALNYTNTTPTVFTNSPRLTSQKDENNETWTTSNVSYTAEPNTTQNMTSMLKMRSLHQYNSSSSQNDTNDEDVSISNASDVAVSYTNTTPTVFTNFTRLTPQRDENNQTGISYNHIQTVDPFSNVSTDPWKEKGDETTKADEGNYETNSTRATFVNTSEQWRETRGTEGSYGFTSEHREEDYNTTANTTATDWSTSQNTDILTTTPAFTITQETAVTDEPEYHTSAGGVNHSTKPQDLFTSTYIESENMTGTGAPIGSTNNNNNNSIITDVLTDNSSYPTTNITDTESKVWPTCSNSSRQSTMVCFITVWALAMTAAIFLGVTIFLWVRLSIVKERMKMKEKRVEVGEKQSLWADPKASVQERVEFWYVNGSTLEADRKDKDRKRQERMKRRGQEQVNEENELWMQPRVTVDDITEFWYANRRMREERMRDMGL
ncbi:mucin-2 [Danio aesculapii]|uniref:mucin-2 n=1 Tax=Danio aesculapii TaxID=1142201 RepID=UPI0024C09E74|nr:mucin-2 [Danio aesculapii]